MSSRAVPLLICGLLFPSAPIAAPAAAQDAPSSAAARYVTGRLITEEGEPVVGVTVAFHAATEFMVARGWAAHPLDETTTDSRGCFAFQEPSARELLGDDLVEGSASTWTRLAITTPDARERGVRFTLLEPGDNGDLVTHRLGRLQGRLTADRELLRATTVSVQDMETGRWAKGHPGSDGAVDLRLPPGVHRLVVTAWGWDVRSSAPFRIAEGETRDSSSLVATELQFERLFRRQRVQILDPEGQPAAGVRVHCLRDGEMPLDHSLLLEVHGLERSRQATADEVGWASLLLPRRGSISLSVSEDPFRSLEGPARVLVVLPLVEETRRLRLPRMREVEVELSGEFGPESFDILILLAAWPDDGRGAAWLKSMRERRWDYWRYEGGHSFLGVLDWGVASSSDSGFSGTVVVPALDHPLDLHVSSSSWTGVNLGVKVASIAPGSEDRALRIRLSPGEMTHLRREREQMLRHFPGRPDPGGEGQGPWSSFGEGEREQLIGFLALGLPCVLAGTLAVILHRRRARQGGAEAQSGPEGGRA